MRHTVMLLAFAGLLAAPAHAAWHEASSEHFLIYADAPPDRLRKMAEMLERFDKGLRFQRELAEDAGRRSNRITVYIVDGVAQLRRICARGRSNACANVMGFYQPRLGGSVAYMPSLPQSVDK